MSARRRLDSELVRRGLARSREQERRIVLLRSFDAESAGRDELDVPDPYYGDEREFEAVFDIVTAACDGLLAHVNGASTEADRA